MKSLGKGITWGGYPSGCGWFCRRKHDVLDALEFLGNVSGNTIVAGLTAWANDTFANGKIIEVPMTPAEEIETDKWSKEQFAPYLLDLIKKVEIIKTNSLKDLEKIWLINLLLGEIAAIRFYYLNNFNSSLSQGVNDALSAYVYECTEPAKVELIKLVPVGFTKLTLKYDFIDLPKPFIRKGDLTTGKFIVELYSKATALELENGLIPDAVAFIETYIYFDTTNIDFGTGGSSSGSGTDSNIGTGSGTNTGTNTGSNNSSDTGTTTTTKKTNWWLWLLAGVAGYKLLK